MIQQKNLIFAFACSLCISFGAHANDIEPSKEFVNGYPAAGAVTIDGDLSEWSGVSIDNPQFSIPKESGDAGTLTTFEILNADADWTGPEDHSTSLQIAYDSDNVYLGLVVTDDYHENAANSAWNGDTVQMMVANDARDTQIGLYNYALGGIEGALGDVIINHEAGPGGTSAAVVRDAAAGQTTYEVMLPKAALGLDSIGAGTQFGLGMAVNDGDEAVPGQAGWGGLGAHAIVFGKSPGETALVTLVPEPNAAGLALTAAGVMFLARRRRRS